MDRVAFWLTIAIAGTIFATPALAEWSAKPINDGLGHSYFIANSTVDKTRAEFFCNPEGIVNFSLTWPDYKHRYAADKGEAAMMRISVDDGAVFEANSYYWASGKGVLILDFGNPPLVRDIVDAIGAAETDITISVDDPGNGIQKTVTYDAIGARAAADAFLDWCPASK